METTTTSLPKIMEHLLKLQELQLREEPPTTEEEARSAELSGGVPKPILDHFDRLLAQGKKGVATVQHGCCGECHVKICSGSMAALAHGTDIQICGNCGRYLFWTAPKPAAETSMAEKPVVEEKAPPVAPKKRVRKPRPEAVAF
jgi:predicted  nucleic acid-binding Zn-ribbon protein